MKNVKRLSFVLAVIMVVGCVLTSCGGKNYKAIKIDPNYVSQRAESTTHTINGVDGTKVTVPKTISKVVCFSREAAAVIRELGFADSIKGGDALTGKVIVGINEITIDQIASVAPDVVFITEDYDTSVLDSADITYLTIPEYMSINDIKSMIKMIEKIYGVTTESLSTKIDNEMTLAQNSASGSSKKYVAFVDMGGLLTSGSGTYVNELLNAAGCENVYADREGFFKVTKEEIIKLNPSVIFTTNKKFFTKDADLYELDAVANNRIFIIEERNIAFGSQGIADALSTMFDSVTSISNRSK